MDNWLKTGLKLWPMDQERERGGLALALVPEEAFLDLASEAPLFKGRVLKRRKCARV